MSSSLLFAAGAFITFITLWGVVMAGGFYAAHRLADDKQILEIVEVDKTFIGPVIVDPEPTATARIAPHPAA